LSFEFCVRLKNNKAEDEPQNINRPFFSVFSTCSLSVKLEKFKEVKIVTLPFFVYEKEEMMWKYSGKKKIEIFRILIFISRLNGIACEIVS